MWYWQCVLYTAIDRDQLYNTVRLTAAYSAQNNTEIYITKQTLNILHKKETNISLQTKARIENTTFSDTSSELFVCDTLNIPPTGADDVIDISVK